MQPDPIAMETTGPGPERGSAPRGRSARTQAPGRETFAEIMAGGRATQAAPEKRSDKADGPTAAGGETSGETWDAAEGPADCDPAATFVIPPAITSPPPAEPAAPALAAADATGGTSGAPILNQPPSVASVGTGLIMGGRNTLNKADGADAGAIPAPPSADMLAAMSKAKSSPTLAPPADKAVVSPATASAAVATTASTAALAPAATEPVAAKRAAASADAEPSPAAADSADAADLLKTVAKAGGTTSRGSGGDAAASQSGPDRSGNGQTAAASPVAGPAAPSPGGAHAKSQPAEMSAAEPDGSPAVANTPAHATSNLTPPVPGPSTQPAATAAGLTAGSETTPQPAAEQVSVHIAKAVKAGLDRIDIQLSPASLGRIEIRLDITDRHHVSASLAADSSDTLDLLKADVRLLERVLHDAGLKTDSGSLSFHLRDQGARPGRDGGARRETRAARGTGPDQIEPMRPAALAAAMSATVPGGGIDIHA